MNGLIAMSAEMLTKCDDIVGPVQHSGNHVEQREGQDCCNHQLC